MTDEERQKLCDSLRQASDDRYSDWASLCAEAADEIERLAKRLAELEQRDRDIANDIRALARWV